MKESTHWKEEQNTRLYSFLTKRNKPPADNQDITSQPHSIDRRIQRPSFKTPFPGETFNSIGINLTPGKQYPLYNLYEGLGLELEEYRRFALHLCAMSLFHERNHITMDHREYWRATGVFAALSIVRGMDSSHFDDVPLPDDTYDFNEKLDRSILQELCFLIIFSRLEFSSIKHPGRQASDYIYHLGRSGQIDGDILENYLNNWSDYFHPFLQMIATYSDNLLTTYGFPVLEGLLRRHCDQIGIDGKPLSAKIDEIPDCLPNDQSDWYNLMDSIKLWEAKNATKTTREALISIDRLNQVGVEGKEPEDLVEMVLSRTNEEELSCPRPQIGTSGTIFCELNNLRGGNQHRGEYARTSAAVLLTLCCLAFWDSISEAFLDRLSFELALYSNIPQVRKNRYKLVDFRPEHFYLPVVPAQFPQQNAITKDILSQVSTHVENTDWETFQNQPTNSDTSERSNST